MQAFVTADGTGTPNWVCDKQNVLEMPSAAGQESTFSTNLGLGYQRLMVGVVGLQRTLVHVLMLEQIETFQASHLEQKHKYTVMSRTGKYNLHSAES